MPSPAISPNLQRKRDEAFCKDIEHLIDMHELVTTFIAELAYNTPAENITLLHAIGTAAKGVYHEEKDGTNIRNKYSLSQHFLPLDTVELLTFLQEEADTNPAILPVLTGAAADIAHTLGIMQANILDVLSKESARIAPLQPALHANITQLLSNNQAQPVTPLDNKTPLARFTAYFYIPKAVKRIAELTTQYDASGFDVKQRAEHYYFARTFAMVGELAKGVKTLMDNQHPLYPPFQGLKNLRDTIKTSHRTFFAKGPLASVYGPAPAFLADFITANLGNNGALLDYLNKLAPHIQDLSHAANWTDASTKVEALCHTVSAQLPITEATDVTSKVKKLDSGLEGKEFKKDYKAFHDSLTGLKNHLKKGSYNGAALDVLVAQFEQAKAQITPAEQAQYNFPDVGTMAPAEQRKAIIQWVAPQGVKPSTAVKAVLKAVSDTKKFTTPQEEEASYKQLLQQYQTEYEKQDKEFQDEYPDPTKEAIADWYEQEKAKTPGQQGTDESFKPMRYYRYFAEESAYLGGILALPETTATEKVKKEAALAHSVGILGEHIRYIFEFDAVLEGRQQNDLTLGTLLASEVTSDLRTIQHVRNKTIMHGVFEYDADTVLTTAQNKAVPWKFEIEAAQTILLYGEIISSITKGGSWEQHAESVHYDSKDELAAQVHFSAASAYAKLSKFDEAEQCLHKAHAAIEDIPSPILAGEWLSPHQNLLFGSIKMGIATVKTNKAMVAATDEKNALLAEAAVWLEEADSYIPDDEYKIKINLQNAMAFVCEQQKNKEAAEAHYQAAMDIARQYQDSVEERQMLFQQAQNLFDCNATVEGREKGLTTIRELIVLESQEELNPASALLRYKLHRVASSFLSELGRKEEAWDEFNQMKDFYTSNPEQFKQLLGATRYQMLEFQIAHDEASLHYYQSDYVHAIRKWEESTQLIAAFKPESEEHARCYMNIANAYKYLAHYAPRQSEGTELGRHDYEQRAKDNYTTAITLLDRHGLSDSLVKAHAHAGSVEIVALDRHRHTQEWREHYMEAKAIFFHHGKEGEYYTKNMHTSLNAILQSQRPRTIVSHAVQNPDSPGALYSEGCALIKKGKANKAVSLFEQVIAKKDFVDDKLKLQAFEQLIECYGAQKQWKKAEAAYNQAKDLLTRNSNFREEHLQNFRSKTNSVAQQYFNQGAFEAKGSWKQFAESRREQSQLVPARMGVI